MKTKELVDYTGQILQVARYRDYAPNGLQVEGAEAIHVLVTGVSASLPLIEAAIELNAQAILVHHGYFWKNEDARIVGIKRQRIRLLLQHDINLLGYHLPLDAHPELGNNIQLARRLDLVLESWEGEQAMLACGRPEAPLSLSDFAAKVENRLNRKPLVIGEGAKRIRRIAWCTGAAQDYLEHAIALEVDVFLTGEVSERTVLQARESGVAFISAGHHATERYGVMALGEHLAEQFGIRHHFIDIDNPV